MSTTKILVTGSSGQLGHDVVLLFRERGYEVLACDRQVLDITDIEQCEEVICGFCPNVVIHCAAYTAVDNAENDVGAAYLINASGTRNVVIASEKVGAKFVYISTDYVFDGLGEAPYHEYDNTNPQSVYGKSKRAGEILTQSLSSSYFIVRTSWVYGKYGDNFVKTMLKLGQIKPTLEVVNDQKGSPTYTVDLACFLYELVQSKKYGIYHASNSGFCTWYEFANAIFAEAENNLNMNFKALVKPCASEFFPRPAPRPRNSVMEHLSIRTNNFDDLRHWSLALKEFIIEMKIE